MPEFIFFGWGRVYLGINFKYEQRLSEISHCIFITGIFALKIWWKCYYNININNNNNNSNTDNDNNEIFKN